MHGHTDLKMLSFIVYDPEWVQSSKTGLHKTLKNNIETSIKIVNEMLDLRYLTMRVKRHRRRMTTHPEAKVVLVSDLFFFFFGLTYVSCENYAVI